MAKRIQLLIVLLSLISTRFGQELTKEKTENYIQINGTNIFIIPPGPFEPTTNFTIFQNLQDEANQN